MKQTVIIREEKTFITTDRNGNTSVVTVVVETIKQVLMLENIVEVEFEEL